MYQPSLHPFVPITAAATLKVQALIGLQIPPGPSSKGMHATKSAIVCNLAKSLMG
jgi:hypothetical protein